MNIDIELNSDGLMIAKDTKHLKSLIKLVIENSVLGYEADLNCIDTSLITDMSHLFFDSKFNGDISKWDVSNVTNMTDMFKDSPLKGNEPHWYKKIIYNV